MTNIVTIKFGSHLYGTSTPASDLDYKSIFIPTVEAILLQSVKDIISITPEKAVGERNKPGDIDREYFSVQRYLHLLAEGQTVALDMLFAPSIGWLARRLMRLLYYIAVIRQIAMEFEDRAFML